MIKLRWYSSKNKVTAAQVNDLRYSESMTMAEAKHKLEAPTPRRLQCWSRDYWPNGAWVDVPEVMDIHDTVANTTQTVYDRGDLTGVVRAEATVAEDAARNRLAGLRRLMGYVENGTDTVVAMLQDDATKTYIVKVGSGQSYFGDTLLEALDKAIYAESPL